MAFDQRSRPDRGFTLTEVLIVVSIIGLLSIVIALVFSVIVRTAPATEARADDARSLLGLSQWIPADVASTPPGSIDISVGGRRANSGCTGAAQTDPGEDLLFLSWAGIADGSSSTFQVIYRWVPSDDGFVVKRYGCRNGGVAQVNTLTSKLQPIGGNIPISITPVPTTGIAIGLVFEVNVIDPGTGQVRELLVLDALSRNISTGLSPVPTIGPPEATTTTMSSTTTTTTTPPTPTDPTASTDPPPSTDSTTTTTIPCAVTGATASPNPVARTSSGNNSSTLSETVTVAITTNGNCAGLYVRYYPEAWQTQLGTVRTAEFQGAQSVDLPSTQVWRPRGDPSAPSTGHLLEILNDIAGPVLRSTHLVVT
jgi:prepilin-type N-terminal cleavage/methylation domain-containing protein